MVPYNNKKYYINVVETKPTTAVSIIETDCEVDFTPPLDYKESEKPSSSSVSNRAPPEGFSPLKMFLFDIWILGLQMRWHLILVFQFKKSLQKRLLSSTHLLVLVDA